MTAKTNARGLRRRSLLRALFAIPLAFAFRGSMPMRPAEEKPDDIVEINGWILRRSDLS